MHKDTNICKKFSRVQNHKSKLIIGMLGTHKGAGVTHISILLANYLSEWLGKNTAFIEYYPQKEVQYLKNYFYKKSEEVETYDPFQVNCITYYSNVKEQAVAEIIGDQYECVVLDLGTDFNRCKNEFLRCDRKIIVSSLSIWKRHNLDLFLNDTSHIKLNNLWTYVIPFSREKEIKQASRTYHRDFYGVPYEPDPFALSADTIKLFQKLI